MPVHQFHYMCFICKRLGRVLAFCSREHAKVGPRDVDCMETRFVKRGRDACGSRGLKGREAAHNLLLYIL